MISNVRKDVFCKKKKILNRKIESFEKKEEHLAVRETFLSDSQAKVDALYQKQLGELERLSGLSTEDAKKRTSSIC